MLRPRKKAQTQATDSSNKATDEPKQKTNTTTRSHIVERSTTEMLPVELTAMEINNYAREYARLHGDIAKLERMKKDSVADFKTKIGALETRIAELQRKIESGREDRQVPCFWRFDYKAGVKTLYSKQESYGPEGPETIKTVPLTPDERQQRLPLDQTKNDRVVNQLLDMVKEDAAEQAIAALSAEDTNADLIHVGPDGTVTKLG